MNTGIKVYDNLKKVSNDGNEYPLDVNNNRCSVSGLPQDIKINASYDPDYIPPVTDLTDCPIPETKVYVWGKIFEENPINFDNGTQVADIFLRTYKGVDAVTPPADLTEPYNCTNGSIAVGYSMNDPQFPSTNNYNTSMSNQNQIRLAAPGTDLYNPYYPKQATRMLVSYMDGSLCDGWYHFSGKAEGEWALLETVNV